MREGLPSEGFGVEIFVFAADVFEPAKPVVSLGVFNVFPWEGWSGMDLVL